jgi:peroxiredoxin
MGLINKKLQLLKSHIMNIVESNTLETSLKELKENLGTKIDHTIIQKFETGIEELSSTYHLQKILQVGDKSPDFELNNALNKKIKLSTILQNGPIVLTWYRGGWCPYCNLNLRYLQNQLSQFSESGATLVALTPELPDRSLSTKEKNELNFEILTDFNNDIAREFGIVYTLNNELKEFYNNFNKLGNFNGVNTNELPIPATYVIDKDFFIRYAFIDPDYRKRAEPSEIINVLRYL